MTDSTVKNASMIAEDTLIKMKHTACGHIANVPNWIIGELAEEETEIECPVVNMVNCYITQKKFILDHVLCFSMIFIYYLS